MLAICIYVLLSLYFGRKNPLFYLFLPYAIQQGPGAFINYDINIAGRYPFSPYDQMFVDVLFFLTAAIAFFYIKAKLPTKKYTGSQLILFYFVYILFLFFISLATYTETNEVFLTARQFFYIPLSYFLWLAIYQAVTREQYEQFLRAICFITPVSALLYIINSSGLYPIYNNNWAYEEIQGLSSSFYRDFNTQPTQLIPVLVICVISMITPTIKLPKWLIAANLVILPVAVLFTFTRSLLITILLTIVLSFALIVFFNIGKIVKMAVTLILLTALFFIPTYFVANAIFPEAVDYFNDRITAAAKEQGNEENVEIRRMYLVKTMDLTRENSDLTGVGLNRSHYAELNEIGAWAVDSTLPFLLYHTGWVGIGLLYIILLYFIVDSFLFYKNTNDWMVAFICASIISSVIASFLMGTNYTGSVWTFSNLALYACIRLNSWKKIESHA